MSNRAKTIYRDFFGTEAGEDLIGSAGRDKIFGYGGKDRLYGQDGDDWLFGGGGDDLLDGGLGRDVMYGGSGNNIYRVDDPGDMVIEESTPGVDDGGIDYVESYIDYALPRFVEKLELRGSKAINGTGNELDNTLKGNTASNALSGGAGIDTLYGQDGNDILIGGAGKDYLYGGTGADTFVMEAVGAVADKIYDFDASDLIGVYASQYGLTEGAGLTNGALANGYFVAGTAATQAHGQFIYDASKLTLFWDPDGNGSLKSVALANFSTGAVVDANQIAVFSALPQASIGAWSLTPQSEDRDAVYFRLELSKAWSSDVTITWSTQDGSAVAGDDFVGVSGGTALIKAGSTSVYLRVDLTDDEIREGLESFSVNIDSAHLADGSSIKVGTRSALSYISDETPQVVAQYSLSALGISDPSGIAYDPVSGHLYMSDSECDESPFFSQKQLFSFTLDGKFLNSYSPNWTDEPTGLTIDPNTGLMYVTDDDTFTITCVDPANPNSVIRRFNVSSLGCDDPEDVAINSTNGHLFVVNGLSRTIVETNKQGTEVYGVIQLPPEITDPEALCYDAANELFYVGGGFSSKIWAVDTSGTIAGVIDILANYRNPDSNTRVSVKDLELAPSSDGSETSLYVADFGSSHVSDGRLFEIDLGDWTDILM